MRSWRENKGVERKRGGLEKADIGEGRDGGKRRDEEEQKSERELLS